ncbi:hypothetical protein BOTBODRAFT_272862 [Botryobasidium botryosum FD-172 SS1]|uniref:Uncharacterized protein n=1 Tax=Botryobasidium botryosum (strain FD-172 SS1) TaxID=930990 RepID=A0A067MW73_BOTB1|nr:hypothetical protein BOTBODRAFT_272862 [Botryobasidium botryosum FD-172 SS1]
MPELKPLGCPCSRRARRRSLTTNYYGLLWIDRADRCIRLMSHTPRRAQGFIGRCPSPVLVQVYTFLLKIIESRPCPGRRRSKRCNPRLPSAYRDSGERPHVLVTI